jgi:hypothetical protein
MKLDDSGLFEVMVESLRSSQSIGFDGSEPVEVVDESITHIKVI